MSKKTLGFILGFFFGILGLLGLLACKEQEDRDLFMKGWLKAFILNIVLIVLIVVIYFVAIAALVGSASDYMAFTQLLLIR